MATPAQYLGTGKRKTSVARVILRPGDGDTWINGKTIQEYFPRQVHQMLATAPLKTAGLEGRYASVYPDRTNGLHRETYAVFAGPAVHYGGKKWWATLSYQPQLFGAPSPGRRAALAAGAGLALGEPLVIAAGRAQRYVAGAIAHGIAIGHGARVLDHFWQTRSG